MLPNLSALSLTGHPCVAAPTRAEDYAEWIRLCGGVRPTFRAWGRMRGDHKAAFRQLVNRSENDRFSGGQSLSPYLLLDIDEIIRRHIWSVEHVLPRSMVNGQRPGRAENDWLGWLIAARSANSARSNQPLVLWTTPNPRGDVVLDGVLHYDPPNESKAWLARLWLYLRATYSSIDDIDPPSKQQIEYKDAILENVRATPIGYAEGRLHALLVKRFGGAWKNPLYAPTESSQVRSGVFTADANLRLAARLVFD
jgi:hypothetical protein